MVKRQPVQQNEADTRERIVAAAVQVFAQHGFLSGTVREITEIAEVNIAAVNYHFGSKDELAKHVLERGIASIIQVRSDTLRACVAQHKPAPPTVEAISQALVMPLVELGSGRYRDAMMLLTHARAGAPPFITSIVEEKFAPLHEEFVDVLQRVLPELSRTEIALRYDCARGAILQTLVTLAPARTLVSGTVGPSAFDHEVTTRRLVSFVAGGFRAPPA